MSEFFKRLTPTVPGQIGAFHISSQKRIVTGYLTGGHANGVGFPQLGKAISISGMVAHYFKSGLFGYTTSLCGRITEQKDQVLLAGNYPHCKDCEKRYTKALRGES